MGAYLELDITQFKNNLLSAGNMLRQFKSEHESFFNGSGIPGAELLDGLIAPLFSAGRAATDFSGIFGRAMKNVRDDAAITGSAIGGIGTGFDRVYDSAAGVSARISAALDIIPDHAEKVIQSSCAGMKNGLNAALPALSAAAKKTGNGIVSAFSDTAGSGKLLSIGSSAVVNLSKGMDSKKPYALSAVTGIMRGMYAAAGSVKFNGIGSSIVSGITKGLHSGKAGLMATAASIASGIAGRIKSVLKISSPSKVTQELGLFTVRGMELGLLQGEHSLYRAGSLAAESVGKGMLDSLTDGQKTIGSSAAEFSGVSPVSADIARTLSGISYSGHAMAGFHSSNVSDRLDRLDKILDAVERLADSQTTVEIDGRKFGRLVREQVR